MLLHAAEQQHEDSFHPRYVHTNARLWLGDAVLFFSCNVIGKK
jgi:hypothetical protein